MMGAQCEYDQDMPPIIRSAVLLEGNFEAGSPLIPSRGTRRRLT